MNRQQQEQYERVGHILALLEELREAEKILLRASTRAIFYDLSWGGKKGACYSVDIEAIDERIARLTDHLVNVIQVEARPTQEEGIDILELDQQRPEKPA